MDTKIEEFWWCITFGFPCPHCGHTVSVEIEDIKEGSEETDCDNCGASLELAYKVKLTHTVEVDNVEISGVPPVEFKCPRCGYDMETEDIEEESGEYEIKCNECGALVRVDWSDWGEDVEVDVLGTPPVKFKCPRCGCDVETEDIEEESGSDEIECDGCGAPLTIEWSDWGEDVEVDVLGAPPAGFECPRCGCDVETEDIEEESGSDEIECDGCGASLMVYWSDWGEYIEVEVLRAPPAEFECPRCGCDVETEDIEEESGSDEIKCNKCGALVRVEWSDWGGDIEVEVLRAPPVKFGCPRCGYDVETEDIEEESGSDEIECDGCGALLMVEWSDWGGSIDDVDVSEWGEL